METTNNLEPSVENILDMCIRILTPEDYYETEEKGA